MSRLGTQPLAVVADDSLMVRRVAARILRDAGYEVEEAKSAEDVLDAARLHMPALVLLDARIADTDAPELIAALRALPGGGEVRMVLCTARREVGFIADMLAAGADEYIIKPFDSDIIESKLQLVGLPARRRARSDAA